MVRLSLGISGQLLRGFTAAAADRVVTADEQQQEPHRLPLYLLGKVIMLVESPDGQRALLGRSAKFTPGMYTCLSGFIDQCESIEEAVRREVREEARVAVSEVQIVGTQPWPIGRYGSSELMLGCVAKARSYEILVNPSEMEDVQWFERAELRAAVELYQTAAGLLHLPDLSLSH
ncbi:nudix hydrolase domain-containing protein [Haematococcus lacustris]|uniref:NAD(+) diphosphatase n=1 Tax=Haematococcus lacustris TaxID=44745 RepID=A0A699ZD70_HAELA|nr:nudix hydrolase domain-containing protein [Haematococcus lacustris]